MLSVTNNSDASYKNIIVNYYDSEGIRKSESTEELLAPGATAELDYVDPARRDTQTIADMDFGAVFVVPEDGPRVDYYPAIEKADEN